MRVLISGGGLAGLTLAYWLERSGTSVTVIERAAQTHHEGYGLDFYGTGYDVAERMGILDRLRQQQIPVESITYVTDRDQKRPPQAAPFRARCAWYTCGKFSRRWAGLPGSC